MRRLVFSCTALMAGLALWVSTHSRPSAAQPRVVPVAALGRTDAGAAVAAAPLPAESGLFRFVAPPDAAQLSVQLPAPSRQIRYVRVDRSQIDGKRSPFWQPAGAGHLSLTLPDGSAVVVTIHTSEMLGADRFTSEGQVEGYPDSRVVFAYNRGFLSADVAFAGRSFALRPATETLTQYYEVDPALVGTCGGAVRPVVDANVIAQAARSRARQASLAKAGGAVAAAGPTAVATSAGGPEVDVMMLYTPAVKPTLSGTARTDALQSEFDAAIASVNANLAASRVVAHVRLVKIAETVYDESLSASDAVEDTALSALQNATDGKMDEIHALRDQVGADVVCLAINRADSRNVIGLSYVLDTPSVSDRSSGLTNGEFAFAVVQYGQIAGTDVVAHELGHTFGCAHARGDPGATGTKDGAFTYSYGYRFTGQDGRQYRDIMAYNAIATGYYSNPDIVAPSPVNAVTGVPVGQPGESDCALTIDRTAFEVAGYRLRADAPASGTLVNVSTRAHVGTGASVMIGGFWIGGAQPKRVLIRAAGPALAAYGVPNPLAAPQVQVTTSAGTFVAANQGWGTQSGGATAADVAAAGAAVDAFPFSAGSADSALLLTLPPGGYTATVSGANGTSGSALVEAYAADSGGGAIVNLSTRAYADVGAEMFGGFVVNGAAGTTKRVLIRVLGPTLERTFGLSGAMNDPTLELHDSSTALLLQNDDWSTGDSTGSANTENDFHPWTKTYSEQEIAATGYAPTNRREPCVMLDLPPGSYSVVVRPFEDLTSTPAMTAQPGVAIVEVYEIGP